MQPIIINQKMGIFSRDENDEKRNYLIKNVQINCIGYRNAVRETNKMKRQTNKQTKEEHNRVYF